MNNPIPLGLTQRVLDAYYDSPNGDAPSDMQAALTAHLPELAACHYREVDVEVIERALRNTPGLSYEHDAKAIAAALSDATNGGHWEEGVEAYRRAMAAGLPRRSELRGPADAAVELNYGWVPADPDAALLAIVDADTLARLREVAEVTAR